MSDPIKVVEYPFGACECVHEMCPCHALGLLCMALDVAMKRTVEK